MHRYTSVLTSFIEFILQWKILLLASETIFKQVWVDFVKIFIPQFRAQDGTSARTKLGSG